MPGCTYDARQTVGVLPNTASGITTTQTPTVGANSGAVNLTVAGIDWESVRPGVRVATGDALLEISAFAVPCAKNAQWFVDGRFRRIDHGRHPGWSRAYAWVIDGGAVAPGREVVVEP